MNTMLWTPEHYLKALEEYYKVVNSDTDIAIESIAKDGSLVSSGSRALSLAQKIRNASETLRRTVK